MSEQISIRTTVRTLATGALWGCALLSCAVAQTTVPASATRGTVDVTLTQFKVVEAASGAEQLVDASTLRPGDVVEYRVVYTNHTGKPVTGLVGELPIPEGLVYVPRSAKPGASRVMVASNDGVFAAEPLLRAGNKSSEPVPYAEYRSVRWSLGHLSVNGVTAVTARAKVDVDAPLAVAR